MEPFYLMASDLVVVPTPYVARNLEEFSDGLRKVSIHAIYYHFIDARLRLKLNTNDFSIWLFDHGIDPASNCRPEKANILGPSPFEAIDPKITAKQ